MESVHHLPGSYHVTELTQCLSRSYFQRTKPIQETVESAWAKVRGTLLHYAGRSFGWSELRLKLTFQLDGCPVTIIGYVDAYDPETATIYDLKTTRFLKWQSEKGFIPRENHIAQVQCYSTFFELYGIVVNRLILVYLDDQTVVAKQVPLGRRREWMIRRATILHHALQASKIPEPEVGPACAYCHFINSCPKSPEAMMFRRGRT